MQCHSIPTHGSSAGGVCGIYIIDRLNIQAKARYCCCGGAQGFVINQVDILSIIAGSDALPGFTLHSELALYVQAGLTPSEAIQIATLNAARVSKTDKDKGSIEPGKISDIIIMDADPTIDINNIRRVSLVIAGDKLIYPNEIYRAIGVKPFTEIAPMAIKSKQVIKGEKVLGQTTKPTFD